MGALAEAFQALPFPPLLATEGGGSGDAARHVDIVVSRNTWARRLGASAVNMATFVCLIVVLAVVAAILAPRHSGASAGGTAQLVSAPTAPGVANATTALGVANATTALGIANSTIANATTAG